MTNFIRYDLIFTKLLSQVFPHNIFFDSLFSFFSLKGGSIFIWILVIALVIFLEERKNSGISKLDKKFIILFSLSFLFTLLLSDVVLKNIFLRSRPFSQPITINNCPKDFSFPSGHAATAFAAAGILSYFDKKRRHLYYIIAVLISYSRIYLGCHYLTDIIAGGIIGYAISQLLLLLRDTFPFRRKN